MLKKVLLTLAVVMMVAGVVYARDVSMSNVSISKVNPGAGTCSITYDLSRTSPTISESQPIWVFVKYRLSTDSDYTGWQDTDNHTTSNDASDDNDDDRANSVNENLNGDVGIVESTGSKTITWTWGSGGTGLSSTDRAKVRVYAIEMVKIGGGNYAMKNDTSAYYRLYNPPENPDTDHCANDYYLQKYPVTARMYADFLNACANRHDSKEGMDDAHKFFYDTPSKSMLQATDNTHGSLTMTGAVGTDAQWDTYSNGEDVRADRPIVYANWYNAYDYCAWAGLKLPEEEHWYKVAGESQGTGAAVSDYYWGDTAPSSNLCNYDFNVNHASDVNDYESNVDDTDDGNVYNAYELAGNVWESTDTKWYSEGETVATGYDASNGPTDYSDSSNRVARGGARGSDANWARAGSRSGHAPSYHDNALGFRAAKFP